MDQSLWDFTNLKADEKMAQIQVDHFSGMAETIHQ
jgi:hypothetical protein